MAVQGKSIHCGFDPEEDSPDKDEVPLPDPDDPVREEPAGPATLGPGAKVKASESYLPPVIKRDEARPSTISILTYQACSADICHHGSASCV